MRPFRRRAPWWVSTAAPTSRWLSAFAIAFTAGFLIISVFGGPDWLPAAMAVIALGLVDAHWRRTRPPSADAPWSWLARQLYRDDRR